MKCFPTFLALGVATAAVAALPPIFDDKPRALASARTVAEFPAGTFLESVLALPDGALLVNSHLDGTLHRVDPATGRSTAFAKISGTIACAAAADDGAFIVSGWLDGKQPAIFRVSSSGETETLLLLPDGQFPNGIARLTGARYLVADSYRGVIWEIDVTAKCARVWFEHATLARTDPKNATPGVNGLELHRGSLYFSNTQSSTLHRLAITADNRPEGVPQLVAAPVTLDDFEFGRDGSLYGTTHIYNVALRLSLPDGAVTVIADASTGVVGCTSAAFGATAADRDILYIVGNGGMTLPLPSGLLPAKIVALKVAPKP